MLKSYLFILLLLSAAISVYSHGGGSDSDSYLDADSDADSTSPNDLRSKSLILVKIYCLILVFLGTFIGGVSPYFFKWNEAFLVLGTQFAGGVFLGTAMMHFLSDSNETFEDLVQDIEYPFAFMLACGGYLLTMLADCVINFVVAKKEGTKMNDSGAVGEHGVGAENKAGHNGGISLPQSDVEHGAHGKSVQEVLSHASSYGDSILLIVALCFHSVFEGIAIGVAESKADAWKALWTICLHKIFAAIAMGIALLRMMPNRPLLSTFSYAFAFAISSPVGVAIGIVIDATTEGKVADWIYAISMGIACGVFIYVAINHLFAKGYRAQKQVTVDTPIYRWLSVVLGIGVIAVVMIWDT